MAGGLGRELRQDGDCGSIRRVSMYSTNCRSRARPVEKAGGDGIRMLECCDGDPSPSGDASRVSEGDAGAEWRERCGGRGKRSGEPLAGELCIVADAMLSLLRFARSACASPRARSRLRSTPRRTQRCHQRDAALRRQREAHRRRQHAPRARPATLQLRRSRRARRRRRRAAASFRCWAARSRWRSAWRCSRRARARRCGATRAGSTSGRFSRGTASRSSGCPT